MKAVYLYPQSSYRTELRSDTLWGLIIVALSYLYDDEEVQSVVDSFKNGNPLFRISSTMYFQEENGEKQHYFPVPHTDPIDSATIPDSMKSKYKKFKKVTRIDKNTFEMLISGQINLKNYFDVWVQNEESVLDPKANEIFKKESILKTHIDKIRNSTREENGKGQLHYSNETSIADGGLFFLIDGETEQLESALRFLEHFGFGGNRSTGKGDFRVEIEDFDLVIPKEPTHSICLSLYSPSKEELENISSNRENVWYDLDIRTGIASQTGEYQKDSVICFTEGSVFPYSNNTNIGKLQKVHNEREIYFNGYGFMIPAKIKETKYAAN